MALEVARSLNEPECWDRLGQAALVQGNHQIVEMCYQRNKNFEKLAFLYLITGNLEKLRKMMKIAQVRKDVSAQYKSALLLGDVQERIEILRESGNEALAFLTAKTHGYDSLADEIKDPKFEQDDKESLLKDAFFLKPPVPVQQLESNWPLLVVSGVSKMFLLLKIESPVIYFFKF